MTTVPDRLHQTLVGLQSGFTLTGLLCNGTVLVVKKVRKHSPVPRLVYQWTRKVKKKTVSVTLTKNQYKAFQAAVSNQRRLLERIRQMQEVSAQILLSEGNPSPKTRPKRA